MVKMGMRPGAAFVGGALVCALAVTGCGPGTSGATKAGGKPEPVVLTIATNDSTGHRSGDEIEQFVRQVEQRSGGGIHIQPAYQAAGENPGNNWDQLVARLVISGDQDLGLIPTRAWDELGVDSLRALNTPFLIDSMALSKRVVADEGLAADLMADLPKAGVTGLTLLPEDLRHIFSFGAPMRQPNDFKPALIRTPLSKTANAAFVALGATVTQDSTDDNPDIAAAETSFAFSNTLPGRKTATGNETLFPKLNALVANSAKLASLPAKQQDILRVSAAATRDWAAQNVPSDALDAAKFCAGDGAVVLATSAQVTAMREATQPVRTELTADPATASIITRIGELAADTPPDPAVEACEGPPPLRKYDDIKPRGGGLPNGIYRVEFTDDYLRAHGMDETTISNNHGVWTTTLRDGHWTIDQVAPDNPDHTEGIYEVTGDRVVWRFHPVKENSVELKWSVGPDRSLRFVPVVVQDPPDFQFDVPWPRVG